VAVLKLCTWRPMRALLLYLWRKCMVPWFSWTFFHFNSLFDPLPWNFGTFREVGTILLWYVGIKHNIVDCISLLRRS
jgi:hypothetical protein